MKKIFSVGIVLCFFISGIGAAAITNTSTIPIQSDYQSYHKHIMVTKPLIEPFDEQYYKVHCEEVSTYIMTPGKPMLPKIVQSVELPFGAQDIEIDITPTTFYTTELNGQIYAAPSHVPLIDDHYEVPTDQIKDENLYASNDLYPSTWFTNKIGCGLNADNEHVTHVIVHLYPIRYQPVQGNLIIAESFDLSIRYTEPETTPLSEQEVYDMVIIAPLKFSPFLKRLIRHKTNHNVRTILKTTNDIYRNYPGVDKPEQIKYFIKDAIEQWDIKYVLLVGGLNSLFWARPRDDMNQGSKDWYVPVRYNNLFDDPEHPLANNSIYDPGVITDLYYADIYEYGAEFSSWDPNGDGIFAAMSRPGVENDTGIDMFPDVCLGRLPCRNIREVIDMVQKIIQYEKQPADPYWFNKMIAVSGDGFLDQEDLDVQWDVNGLLDGQYTIHGQSTNLEATSGVIDTVTVTLDRTRPSELTFTHDDHLSIETYPCSPVVDITSPSEGNILGNTDFFYEPTEGEAYCNGFSGWANVCYENGIMHIRGKSYDPQPYGTTTDVHIWITNSVNDTIFSEWRYGTEMYYEGEWITGEQSLMGKGGALYYMPDHYDREILWTSNGRFTGQDEVLESLSQGAGFVFCSGHGSPRTWGDHFPGVPGNRGHGSVSGLVTISFWGGPPFLPMEHLKNFNRPFICVVGGCHNSQFNVSIIPSILDAYLPLYMWTYGRIAPECWSWWITKLPKRGAIATLGNTGLGYGTMGAECTIGGLDGGITLEFFRQYGECGYDILGEAYCQTQTYYASTFDMEEDDHIKSLQQWILFGDPSLKIGGYPS
jgi:hypothetical protein